MRFKSATIKDFKRFTNLTVQGIPDTARLIVLAGPNGCGKSSFFDALQTWHNWTSKKHPAWDMDYRVKAGSPSRDQWTNDVVLEFHDSFPEERKKVFYVRSAYRNDPDFQIHQLKRTGDPLDEVRVSRMIDNDAAVSRNYQGLGSPRHPSGITTHETSSAVKPPGRLIAVGSVMIRGLRCKPLSVHCRKVADTASAAIRGSTIPGSILAISRDSNMGEWAVGMLYILERACVSMASTPPQGFTMAPRASKVTLVKLRRHVDHGRNRYGIILSTTIVEQSAKAFHVLDTTRSSPRGRMTSPKFHRWIKANHLWTQETISCPCAAYRVNC